MFRGIPPIKLDSSLAAASHVQSLEVTLVLSRQDYGKAVLIGLPTYLVCHLQSVLNARLINYMRSADHINDTLACLHWLCVLEWIDYKVAVLTHKALHGIVVCYHSLVLLIYPTDGHYTLDSTSRLLVSSARRSTVSD